VLAPEQLGFCQELLDGMNRGDGARKDAVRGAWAPLEARSFEESPEGVQLANLAAIELHVLEHRSRAVADLTLLNS
jgi:hypothetical protein